MKVKVKVEVSLCERKSEKNRIANKRVGEKTEIRKKVSE